MLVDMKYAYLHRQKVLELAKQYGIDSEGFKYHDCDKIAMALFYDDETLTQEHRRTQAHHDHNATDENVLLEMMLDWESARYTTPDKPLNACACLYEDFPDMVDKMLPVLKKYRLDEPHCGAISQENFEKLMETVSVEDIANDIAEYIKTL